MKLSTYLYLTRYLQTIIHRNNLYAGIIGQKLFIQMIFTYYTAENIYVRTGVSLLILNHKMNMEKYKMRVCTKDIFLSRVSSMLLILVLDSRYYRVQLLKRPAEITRIK